MIIDKLETVWQIDRSSGSYEFDYMTVFRDKATGKLYYGTDSGCSCPSPYESVSSLADLEAITDAPDSLDSFVRAAKAFRRDSKYLKAEEVAQFIQKVKDAAGATNVR